MSCRNRQLIETLVMLGDTSALAADVIFVDRAQDRSFAGRDEARRFFEALLIDCFADVGVTPLSIAADEHTVAMEFHFRGRQQGRFLGIPATGRLVLVPMVLVCEVAQNTIKRAALYYDAGTMLRQLGVTD